MSAAQNVSGNVNLNVAFTQVQSTGVIGPLAGTNTQTLNELIAIADQIANGTGAGKTCDQLYAAQITLVASTPQTFHFETASLKDPFGNTLAMLRIRLLLLQNIDPTSGHDVKAEASASNGITWLPTAASTFPLLLRANFGLLIFYDPNSNGGGVGNVVGATTDGLTLDPGTNTVTSVNILVGGDSVA